MDETRMKEQTVNTEAEKNLAETADKKPSSAVTTDGKTVSAETTEKKPAPARTTETGKPQVKAAVKKTAPAGSRRPAGKKKNPAVIARQRQMWFRIAVQVVFFLLAPSVYASAFTAVKNSLNLIGQGQPLEMTAFVTQLLITVIFTILFGRFFCGWACAFGALGDWVYKISSEIQKKTKKKLPSLSEKQIGILQWGKYIVLVLILLLCFAGKNSLVSQNSPWTVFSLLRSGHFDVSGNLVGVLLLVLILVGMAFQERFFCQFLCPMGAIFSLLPLVPFLHLKRNRDNCPAKCNACRKNCPVSIKLGEEDTREGECIRCGRCSGICPKGNISSMGHFKGNELWMDGIKAIILLVLVLVLV